VTGDKKLRVKVRFVDNSAHSVNRTKRKTNSPQLPGFRRSSTLNSPFPVTCHRLPVTIVEAADVIDSTESAATCSKKLFSDPPNYATTVSLYSNFSGRERHEAFPDLFKRNADILSLLRMKIDPWSCSANQLFASQARDDN
jgi:hypothetical protein